MSAQHPPAMPEIIYLQWFGDEDPDCMTKAERESNPTMDEVSWCWERIFEYDIEYIQLAKHKELEQQRDELLAVLNRLNRLGGLGLDTHKAISEAIAKAGGSYGR